jgi:hypothetical protein
MFLQNELIELGRFITLAMVIHRRIGAVLMEADEAV